AILAELRRSAPHASVLRERTAPIVQRDVVSRDGLHVDVYLPTGTRAPWVVLIEQGACGKMADELQRKGIAVAVVSSASQLELDQLLVRRFAGLLGDISAFMNKAGIESRPFLAGASSGASLVARIALDPSFDPGPSRPAGVIVINGSYESLGAVRTDAPG